MRNRNESAEERVNRFKADLDYWIQRFDLQELVPFHLSNRSLLLQGTRQRDQLKVIVKFPSSLHGARREVLALKAFANNGCVPLLDVDLDLGVILLQKIEPGFSLLPFFPEQDDRALKQCLQLIKRLQKAPVADLTPFTSITEWAQPLFKRSHLDEALLKEVRKLATYLLESVEKPRLLHGDLHHLNILAGANDEWLAIDPLGVVCEEAFEASSFITYPTPQLLGVENLAHLLKRRIDHFSEALVVDRIRVQGWATVRAMRLACIEEYQHPNSAQEWLRLSLALLLL